MQLDAVETVTALARAAAPRCGGTVVIGIDGPSGAGKTTLAEAVGRRLRCPAVHIDDLIPGWDGLAQAAGLLADQVLRPLAAGRAAGYRRWDWDASGWAEWVAVPSGPQLIVEGCASTAHPAAGFVAVRVWVEADEGVRMVRGIERDGEAYRPNWERWAAQERALFGADRTRERADLVLRT
ncbi:MAG: 4-amino-4-deoxy-L-arabinose transferase [Micropruina sp.]|uniref:4-amino-4-deoxy-L-arabinose transferase n=1 Tax=Micropruina sp. TaxID=2737536 RepID=UPI0039E4301D